MNFSQPLANNDADRAAYLQLLELVEGLGRDDTHGSESFMNIQQAIKEGAPLNPVHEDDRSLVAPLIEGLKRHGETIYPHVDLLIWSGANPMWRGDFRVKLLEDYEEIADYLLCVMNIAQDNGKAMFGQDGQTALHTCLTCDAWYTSSNNLQWMNERIHPQWINAQRTSDGVTPLHALWNDIAPGGGSMACQSSMAVWKETRAMMSKGARLDIPDQAGNTVADLICQCLDRGFRMEDGYGEILEMANHIHQAGVLNKTTPTAATRNSRVRRV